MKERVLITGICGFSGRHMCDYLNSLQPRPDLIGVDIESVPPAGCDSFCRLDLSSADDVMELMKRSKPDYVIHLAGTYGTQYSGQTYKMNVLSITSLLEAARFHAPKVVFVAVGSAAEYGRCEEYQLPVTEQGPCLPITHYGLSKLLATQITQYYCRVHSLCAMIVRPFQLIGKGISPKLAPGAFAEQLRQAITSGSRAIRTGNLDNYRDFLDIGDAVEAIWMLCRKPAAGQVFNLCSGRPTKIAELLEKMIECSNAKIKIEVDPERLRGANDVPKIFGSYEKINLHCGWKPRRTLTESVQAMLG